MTLSNEDKSLLYKGRALWYFINERESIRLKKESGAPRPWTKDPILNEYRFCNVFRRHDRVSRWLIHNWYEPNKDHPNLWFAAVVARQINWTPTLEKIGFPHSWNPDRVYKIMSEIKASGEKLYTGAYVIAAGETGVEKHRHTVYGVLDYVWKNKVDLHPRPRETLESAHTRFKRYPGFGDFLAFEVVLDWLETPILSAASDRLTFAAAGPGAITGLNRIFERPLETKISFDQALYEMRELGRVANLPEAPINSYVKRPFDLADIEGVLCETRKYLKTQQDGKSRDKYVPSKDVLPGLFY